VDFFGWFFLIDIVWLCGFGLNVLVWGQASKVCHFIPSTLSFLGIPPPSWVSCGPWVAFLLFLDHLSLNVYLWCFFPLLKRST